MLRALRDLLSKQGFSWTWTGWFGLGGPVNSPWTYFKPEEVKGLDLELCAMLDRARGLAGIPFTITSGLRTQTENDALPNSVKDSSHLTGHAVDLACSDNDQRYKMLRGLIMAGFNRIGVYAAHLHADNSPTLPPNVIWYVAGA